MLKEILQIILSGNITSTQQIAESLGIQIDTLEDMLRILHEKGMLTMAECGTTSPTKCASCPIAESSCSDGNLGHVYYITDRGRRYAER